MQGARAPQPGVTNRPSPSGPFTVPSAPDRSQGNTFLERCAAPRAPASPKGPPGPFCVYRGGFARFQPFSATGDWGWARCAGSFGHRGHDCCQSKLVMSQTQQTRHYIARAPRTPGCTCSGDRGVPPGRYDNPMSPLHCHNGLMASCLEARRRVLSHLISLMRM